MSRAPEHPSGESPGSHPRLGDLLLDAGLITQQQLDEGLMQARAAGRPLGQVLVEAGMVPPHSIAMALADQHGGPLKTEFGFATGRGRASEEGAPRGLHLAPTPADQPQEVGRPPASDTGTTPRPIIDRELEAERAARRRAEAELDELRARAQELERGNDESLVTIAALRTELSGVHDARANDAKAVEAWRVQLEEARTRGDQTARTAEDLQTQLDELRARDEGQADAVATVQKELDAVRGTLAAALADAEHLRAANADEHAGRERAEQAAATLEAQLHEREADDARDEILEAVRAELAAAVTEVGVLRESLSRARSAHEETETAAAALRARVTDLEAHPAETQSSVLDPDATTVDELRSVIELQEQALAAAADRERARGGDPRLAAERSEVAPDSNAAHFLFAPGADGYELVERAGPAPTAGDLIVLPGNRTCRVLRVGPSPWPGSTAACAYLELA